MPPPPIQMTREQRIRRRFFYGWWLVLIAGLVMVIATAPLFDAMSVWAFELQAVFGWSTAQLALALTLGRVISGLVGPLAGFLVDSVGVRKLVISGFLILGGGWIFFSRIESLWMFYVAFGLLAVGSSLAGWIPLMTMLVKWFTRRRSLAVGLANMVSPIGAMLVVLLIALLAANDPGSIGWRTTALMFGIGVLALAAPLAYLVRNRPEDMGKLPDGLPGATPQTGFSILQTLRIPAFWLIAFGDALASMGFVAFTAFIASLSMLTDRGLELTDAAWVSSMPSLFSFAFYLVGGLVGDRVAKRVALASFTALQAVGLAVAAFADSLPVFWMAAAAIGMGAGGRFPVSVAILADYFGTGSFGKILGLFGVIGGILGLFATPLAEIIYDVQGSYIIAFLLLAGLSLLGALCFLRAHNPQLPQTPDTPSLEGEG